MESKRRTGTMENNDGMSQGGMNMKDNTLNNDVVSDAVKARREYYRKWRKRNQDKVKQYQLTFWTKQHQKKQAANS